MKNNKTEIFNKAAYSYDKQFTFSNIGVLQRNRVYYFLEQIGIFKEKKTVFEINCGTGYDAEQFFQKGHSVIATDGSSKMIDVCKEARSAEIDFYQLSFQEIGKDKKLPESNFLFSNFGGINCLTRFELKEFVSSVSQKQKSNDQLAWVIIPKHCLWESVYLFVKGKWSKLGRRNTDNSVSVEVEGEQVPTFYYSPQEVSELLEKDYTIQLIKPIAFFLPPSYLEPFFSKNKWFLHILNNFEKLLGNFSFLANRSDHYIIVAKRK
jgi:hypothetical protein